MRKRILVRDIAGEVKLDVDEVLLLLWDAGYTKLDSPDDPLSKDCAKDLRRVLGIATRRELKSVSYWKRIFSLKDGEFQQMLKSLSVELRPKMVRLPKNAVTLLKSEARRRGINPLTSARTELPSPPPVLPAPTLRWEPSGHIRELRWLTEDEAERIHAELVSDFASSKDPIFPPGVKSQASLSGAVHRPQTSNGTVLKYPTIESSAAALLHSLVLDHPFHNGNKRTALVAMLVFLDENGLFPDFTEDEAFKFVLLVAQHRIVEGNPNASPDEEVLAITQWLCSHTRLVEKENRAIPFRKLRQVLSAFGCEFEKTKRDNTRIAAFRTVKERTVFGLSRERILRTQIGYHDEGSEVNKGLIRRIRSDLHLDDLHNVDSMSFYAKLPSPIGDFISTYRKLLCRLARL